LSRTAGARSLTAAPTVHEQDQRRAVAEERGEPVGGPAERLLASLRQPGGHQHATGPHGSLEPARQPRARLRDRDQRRRGRQLRSRCPAPPAVDVRVAGVVEQRAPRPGRERVAGDDERVALEAVLADLGRDPVDRGADHQLVRPRGAVGDRRRRVRASPPASSSACTSAADAALRKMHSVARLAARSRRRSVDGVGTCRPNLVKITVCAPPGAVSSTPSAAAVANAELTPGTISYGQPALAEARELLGDRAVDRRVAAVQADHDLAGLAASTIGGSTSSSASDELRTTVAPGLASPITSGATSESAATRAGA